MLSEASDIKLNKEILPTTGSISLLHENQPNYQKAIFWRIEIDGEETFKAEKLKSFDDTER